MIRHKHKHTRRTNLSVFPVLTAYTYVDPVFACLHMTVLVLMLICACENQVKDRRDTNVCFSPTQTSC